MTSLSDTRLTAMRTRIREASVIAARGPKTERYIVAMISKSARNIKAACRTRQTSQTVALPLMAMAAQEIRKDQNSNEAVATFMSIRKTKWSGRVHSVARRNARRMHLTFLACHESTRHSLGLALGLHPGSSSLYGRVMHHLNLLVCDTISVNRAVRVFASLLSSQDLFCSDFLLLHHPPRGESQTGILDPASCVRKEPND